MRAIFAANLSQTDEPEWWICVATEANAMGVYRPIDNDRMSAEMDVDAMHFQAAENIRAWQPWPFDAEQSADIARHLGITTDRLPATCWVMEE